MCVCVCNLCADTRRRKFIDTIGHSEAVASAYTLAINNTHTQKPQTYDCVFGLFRISFPLADSDTTEPEMIQDILTCGSCMKKFVLSDILLFIDHKVAQCNKENYGPCYSQGKFQYFYGALNPNRTNNLNAFCIFA